MELFSEIYGCYYTVVAKILEHAHQNGISRADIETLVQQHAFAESGLHLIPRLLDGRWSLLRKNGDGTYQSRLVHPQAATPITRLQKSWLKALLSDERIRLFVPDEQLDALAGWLKETPPLYRQQDFHLFDVARDGDDYTNPLYVQNFRHIFAALKNKKPILVEYNRYKGNALRVNLLPLQMQYSEKDNKFRILGAEIHSGRRTSPMVLNMGRIASVHSSRRQLPEWFKPEPFLLRSLATREVLLHISPQRNALERSMLQFAFYNKVTQPHENGQGHYCRIQYQDGDETELLIRILSFGPVVQVLEPESFVTLMKLRVQAQFDCFNRQP